MWPWHVPAAQLGTLRLLCPVTSEVTSHMGVQAPTAPPFSSCSDPSLLRQSSQGNLPVGRSHCSSCSVYSVVAHCLVTPLSHAHASLACTPLCLWLRLSAGLSRALVPPTLKRLSVVLIFPSSPCPRPLLPQVSLRRAPR